MKCPLCDRKITIRFTLFDRAGDACGDYCSRACARGDAWGPRFRTFTVRRKASARRLL